MRYTVRMGQFRHLTTEIEFPRQIVGGPCHLEPFRR